MIYIHLRMTSEPAKQESVKFDTDNKHEGVSHEKSRRKTSGIKESKASPVQVGLIVYTWKVKLSRFTRPQKFWTKLMNLPH